MKQLFLLLALLSNVAFAVGSSTVTRKYVGSFNGQDKVEVVTISWTGDATDGTVPSRAIALNGYLVKVVTNPGAVAPTANYDMALGDPSDSTLDALATAINNRHTANTEQVYPMIAGTVGTVTSRSPLLAGTYTWSLSNNSVASATGDVILYLASQP